MKQPKGRQGTRGFERASHLCAVALTMTGLSGIYACAAEQATGESPPLRASTTWRPRNGYRLQPTRLSCATLYIGIERFSVIAMDGGNYGFSGEAVATLRPGPCGLDRPPLLC